MYAYLSQFPYSNSMRGAVKGSAFERVVKKDLQRKGALVVRQGRSLFPDIVAVFKGPEVWLVECKAYAVPRAFKFEKAELCSLAESRGCTPVWATPGRTLKEVAYEFI